MNNLDVAYAFYEIADLLELKGEEPFKVRAYRKAAEAVELIPEEIAELARQGRLLSIPGIGKATSEKIRELLETGQIEYLEELRRAIPPGVRALTRVPGLGAKTAQILYTRLGIDSLDRLELAARRGELRDQPGMGARKESQILDGLQKLRNRMERATLGAAGPIAEALVEALRRHPAVLQIAIAGSVRRRRETIGDIDILVGAVEPQAVLDAAASLPIAGAVLERSDRSITLETSLGRRLEVQTTAPPEFARDLMRLTGSAAHMEALGELPLAETEAAIYAAKGLPYIIPELREGLGEIEAARSHGLPQLLTVAHLKGDLHTHTRASDGTATLLEMAEAARARGHRYLAICDHSQSLAIAGGLTPERVRLQWAEIARVQRAVSEIRLLRGTEVDILKDGSLDFPDELLRELDVVVASIHSHMKLGPDEQTERLLRAIYNPHVDIIGHPTGRVLTRRDPYPLHFERILQACRETGTALEISASPARLDLSDLHARLAKQYGVKVVINTDAHSTHELDLLEYGVGQARRAWIEPGDVVNAMEPAELMAWLAKEKG